MTIAVFLADDHTVVREGLRAYLDAEPDIQVVGEAGNGRDAVELIAELEPDVAVLDIGMPELNGVDATAEICRRNPSVQVVILSMHSTNEYVFRALQGGASGFVVKDSAGRELIDAVHAVHAGHRYLSQKISDQVIEDYVEHREAIEDESPLDRLSDREQQILKHLVEGKTTAEISESLSLSNTTVNTYRSRLMKKLNMHDLPSLVKFAIRHGLTEVE
ncbi:MAG: response regulator transcription factor [Chloroflexota bacterium]|nr:response regulator transcription factor [Chloroflexota bacterium]